MATYANRGWYDWFGCGKGSETTSSTTTINYVPVCRWDKEGPEPIPEMTQDSNAHAKPWNEIAEWRDAIKQQKESKAPISTYPPKPDDGSRDQTVKTDAGKLELELIPTSLTKALGVVLTRGRKQYGRDTWKTVDTERIIGALERHLMKYKDDPYGLDKDSGLPHIFHVLCNAMFLNHGVLEKLQKDGKFLWLNDGKAYESMADKLERDFKAAADRG